MPQSNISTVLGYETDGLIPQFPLPTYNTHVIPEHVLQAARNSYVRIIDMWGGNQSVFQLSSWLEEIGINVIQTITNEQIGPSCGYIAAHVAWLLHDNTEWQTQDVSSALDRNMIVQYNAVLNQPRPTYLTDNQILDVLTHLQFSQSGSRNLHWIHGPMPLDYLIQYFRNHFSGARRTRSVSSQDVKIFIINTTPVTNIQLNLSQRTISGDHWVVRATYLQ